jgi:predicted HAD superfamily Cof-like phosphohydrolase
MNKMQELVREFMLAKNQAVPEKPTRPSFNVLALRQNLHMEELTELNDAMWLESLDGVAKEISDALYVVLGTACAFGLDIEPLFIKVHESNLTKLGEQRPDGKVLKSNTYTPPDLAPLIREQLLGQAPQPVS